MLFLATNCLTFPVLLLNTYHKLHGYKIEWQFPGMSFTVVTLTGFTGLITMENYSVAYFDHTVAFEAL